MKPVLFVAALATATPAFANEKPTDVVIYDHNKFIVQQTPVLETMCNNVKIPIYETVQRQGNAAEGALLGMILGGIAGKAITGKDDGAAVGAIMGGVVGADKGGQPKTSQRITGYEWVTKCEDVTTYQNKQVEVYSHSTIRFYIDGKRYVLNFQK